MRSRWVGRLVTTAVAVTMLVPLAAPGAQAAAPARNVPGRSADVSISSVQAIIAAAQAAYGLYKQFASSSMSVEEATRQILTAINSAKTEIISHIDQIATAQAKACARQAIIDFADIERFTPDTLQAFARDATGCVTLIDSLLGAVADKAAIDQLGFALDAVGPVALIARGRAGLSTQGLADTLVSSNTTVISKLAPSCRGVYREGMLEWYACTAYNGDRGKDDNSADRAADLATANISWGVAKVSRAVLLA
jgi:hypothetical protein